MRWGTGAERHPAYRLVPSLPSARRHRIQLLRCWRSASRPFPPAPPLLSLISCLSCPSCPYPAPPALRSSSPPSCQLDVIESNFKVLEERIGAAHDFAEAERAHSAYLHALVNQCFLNTGTITRAIGAVFTQVQVRGRVNGGMGRCSRAGRGGRAGWAEAAEWDGKGREGKGGERRSSWSSNASLTRAPSHTLGAVFTQVQVRNGVPKAALFAAPTIRGALSIASTSFLPSLLVLYPF